MLPLRLQIYLMENERKITNFNLEQWNELCIIFEKLIRNLKEEVKTIKINSFDKSNIPYITMEVDLDEDVTEEKLSYIANYLCGNETENPVYLNDKIYYTGSDILLEEDPEESFLERFKKLAIDTVIN